MPYCTVPYRTVRLHDSANHGFAFAYRTLPYRIVPCHAYANHGLAFCVPYCCVQYSNLREQYITVPEAISVPVQGPIWVVFHVLFDPITFIQYRYGTSVRYRTAIDPLRTFTNLRAPYRTVPCRDAQCRTV